MPAALRLGRIQRYILREIAVPFLLFFVVACFVFLSAELLSEVINRWLNRGLNLMLALRIMGFLLPPVLIFTLPLALLLATLVSFGRLSEDLEIVALQASGVSWGRMFGPVLALGLVAALFNTYLTSIVIPQTRLESRKFLVDTFLSNPTLLLEAQTWLPEVRDMSVWIGAIDDQKQELYDLRIHRTDEAGRTQSITAARGVIQARPGDEHVLLELYDGTMHRANPRDPEMYDLLKFKHLRIPFPVEEVARWTERSEGLRADEKTLPQVWRDLRADRREGRPVRKLWREIGERTAMPFACLTFVLVGVPLSIRPHKAIRFYGAVACVGLVLIFYVLYSIGEVMARYGVLHPVLSFWLPNLFLGGAGGVAMVRIWRR